MVLIPVYWITHQWRCFELGETRTRFAVAAIAQRGRLTFAC